MRVNVPACPFLMCSCWISLFTIRLLDGRIIGATNSSVSSPSIKRVFMRINPNSS
ncbi:unnamed protein product, partial [Nesidiocoris tenuis]